MATFRFGRDVNMKWQGNDIQGPAGTIFRISDAYYEEFNSQVGQVEPTLEWLVTNELAAVQSQVAGLPVSATLPITATTSTAGTNISFAVGTAPAGYVLTSNGSGSAAFAAAAAATPATVVQGTSPISVSTSSNTATVSLSANYQTAGTYVTSVSGTSPITVSGTTAITVSIDPTLTTANSAEIIRQYVKNDSGVALTKGQPVYITGANGTNVLIGLSAASAEATSSKTLGLLEQNLAINGLGYVITEGRLTNIDTSTATAGQSVWLGASAGSKTYGDPPAEPNHGVYLGVVTKANASTGEIFVKVQNGYELDELHDVSAASPSDGDIIQYKTSSSLWTNSSITNAGIATSGHSHSGLLPTGGTTGQVLSKVSGTNYDVTWSAATGGASLSNTAAIALSTTASAGTATDASRQDHVHPTTGINKVYYQTTTPTGGSYTTGDLWIDSDATLGGPITLIDSTSSTSTTTAATPKNVKTTYDIATAGWEAYNFGASGVIGNLPKFILTTTETITSGTIYHNILIPHRDFTVSNISFTSGGTLPTTPTLIRYGIYTRSGTTFTLVARTASDTTIFSSITTKYTRALDTTGGYPATYTMTAGTEYWISLIVVATAGPTVLAAATRTSSAANAATGVAVYTQTGRTDLSASSTGTASGTQVGKYAEVS